jgi:DNA-binding transcriptional LysR family regulator
MITLRQLEVFIAVAQYQNVSRAAEQLCLTQSATSISLSQLEKNLNYLLFDRKGKKLVINQQGQKIFPKAKNILDNLFELENTLQSTELTGTLTIGASSTVGNYLLPKLLSTFKTEYPNISLSLSIQNTQKVIENALNYDIDIGIIEGIETHPELDIEPIMVDKLVFIARNNSPLTTKILTQRDLSKCQWVLREKGSGTRQFIDYHVLSKLSNIHTFIELNHFEAIKQVIKNSNTISCVSRTVLNKEDLKEITILDVPEYQLTRSFYLVLHKKRHQSLILKKWLSMLTQLTHE